TKTGTGYWDRQVDSTIWEVRFIANRKTNDSQVNRYLIYRSAELTAGHGFDYFRVLNSSNDSSGASLSGLPYYSRMNGQQPSIKLPPDELYAGTRSTGMIVQMFHGLCPTNDSNSYDAKPVLATMGPKLK
ncbi:MAG TPA: hypothetical protein VFX22_05515, partial [Candidatus Kapabacteria bacterium]|nr:hypothetical protein [Candidatus Kapabacteria bacterium]